MVENETRKNRVVILVEDDIQKVLEIIQEHSKDKNIRGKLSYAIFKEGLFKWLDEIDCKFSIVDTDVKHLLRRNNSYIVNQQFKITIKANKLQEEKHE